MNRHVGASFTLSVLIVVFFAIILYEPDRSRPTPPPSSTAATTVESSMPPGDAPPPPPDMPLIEASPEPLLETARTPSPPPPASTSPTHSRPAEVLSSTPTPAPTQLTARSPRVPSEPPAVIQITSRRRPLIKPGRHSAFTQVSEGESLTDVALRVYGTPEAASALWRANRDIIAHREDPLDVGLLLRTP